MDDIGGEWKTIGGRHIFIRNGEDLETAMKRSGKFKVKENNNNWKIDNDEEEFRDSKGQTSTFYKVEGKQFKDALDKAKEKQPEDKKWRVDNSSHTAEEYNEMKTYTTSNGSVVAVTKDGDIVSVCGSKGDKGRTLLEYAVKNGGQKLDSYDGNWEVYTRCGFEPVSWCKFEEQYAPSDWRKGQDQPEPIVFFKYTGKRLEISKDDFYKKVKDSKDYDEAMKKRDKGIKK